MFGKKMAFFVLAVVVTALIGSVSVFALFNAPASNSFTAGTVTLGAVSGCARYIGPIAPGASGSFQCSVTYTGDLAARVGYTSTLSGDLTTCSGGGHLTAPGTNTGATPVVLGDVAGDGESRSVTVNWVFAQAAGNDCLGETGTITVHFHALEAAN